MEKNISFNLFLLFNKKQNMMIEWRQNQYSPVASTLVMNKTSLLLAISIRDKLKTQTDLDNFRKYKPCGEIIII